MKRATLLIVLGISPLFAGGGFGYWLAGLGYGEVPAVSGYPSPKNYGLMWGGEGYGIWNKFIFGGGGYGINGFSSEGSGFASSSGIWAGYFSLGYAILKSEKILLFPSVRIGGGGYNLEIREIKSGSYNDFIQNPPKYILISSAGWYGGLSLGFMYRTPVLLGLNAGIGYVFYAGYYINENEVRNSPEYKKPVMWMNLIIGGGYWK